MQKIIVADDGSGFAQKAIDKAVELAKKEESEIICVNVMEDYCPIGLTEIDCNVVTGTPDERVKYYRLSATGEIQKCRCSCKGDHRDRQSFGNDY